MTKVNFTQALIRNYPLPQKGERIVLKDSVIRGLQCRISHTGIKTFSLYRRIKGGGPERITLGKFNDLCVEKARLRATEINVMIARGDNPAEVKRVQRAELTFDELFTDYLLKHAKLKNRTWEASENTYKKHLKKPLGKKRISLISKKDIAEIHRQLSTSSRNLIDGTVKSRTGATANRVLALTSSIFNWGISQEVCALNPATGIKKNPEKSRDRFLQPDELTAFFSSLLVEENIDIRDFCLMLLLTGARRMNTLAAKWDEISFERKEWRIPRTKNGESQVIPLGVEILNMLKSRQPNHSGFVFAAEGRTGHLAEPKKGWNRILVRAKIENLRMHDLRRTFGSWQAKAGASLLIIGKSLGHKSPQATAIYSRLDIDPIRKSVEAATASIIKSGGIAAKQLLKQ